MSKASATGSQGRLLLARDRSVVAFRGLVRIPAGVSSVGDSRTSHWAILEEYLGVSGGVLRLPALVAADFDVLLMHVVANGIQLPLLACMLLQE
jgi:hypothetical protein